jgi:hypothetical protein
VDDARPGDETHPIVMQIALPRNDGADAVLQALRDALLDENITIDVQFTDDSGALQAVCSGTTVISWVNPFTYTAARKQCDVVPVLAVRQADESVGRTAVIFARPDVADFAGLAGKTFCRSYEQDPITRWVFPSLIMAEQGVDPSPLVAADQPADAAPRLGAIQDYKNNNDLLNALLSGECDAAAVAPADAESILTPLARRLGVSNEELVLLAGESPPFPVDDPNTWAGYAANVVPYEVLIFPPENILPASIRVEITEILAAFFNHEDDGPERSRMLLNAAGVIDVTASDLAGFATLVDQARWDITFVE